MIKMIATTIRSSISENPLPFCIEVPPTNMSQRRGGSAKYVAASIPTGAAKHRTLVTGTLVRARVYHGSSDEPPPPWISVQGSMLLIEWTEDLNPRFGIGANASGIYPD